MARAPEFKIELIFEKRPDGRYYIHSSNVPGLHLAGPDLAALCADIEPAVKDLLKGNMQIDVDEVRWIPTLEEMQKHFGVPAGTKAVYIVTSRNAA